VDLAALPLIQLEGVELKPCVIAECDQQIAVGPAEIVSVIGFPFAATGGGGLGIWTTDSWQLNRNWITAACNLDRSLWHTERPERL
jgi:hypothetical protein